jgi:hypothetical protein
LALNVELRRVAKAAYYLLLTTLVVTKVAAYTAINSSLYLILLGNCSSSYQHGINNSILEVIYRVTTTIKRRARGGVAATVGQRFLGKLLNTRISRTLLEGVTRTLVQHYQVCYFISSIS